MAKTNAASLNQSRDRRPQLKGGLKAEPKIIFQTFFKSVGPRTYAAQVKEIANGNHLLVLTEGKRDDQTDAIRKTRLFVYAEDFPAMFKLLEEAKAFIESNPVSNAAQAKRKKFWERHNQNGPTAKPVKPEAAEPAAGAVDELDP